MMARETAAPPYGEDWAYEFQWGGERVRAIKRDGGVHLIGKDGRELANRFPRVAAAVERLRTDEAMIDGEILLLDGYSPAAITRLAELSDEVNVARVAFVAFDLLEVRGRDLKALPLLCRRFKLAALVQGTPIILAPRAGEQPATAIAEAARLGLPGIVAKRDGSAYRPNASTHDWVKVSFRSLPVHAGGPNLPSRLEREVGVGRLHLQRDQREHARQGLIGVGHPA